MKNEIELGDASRAYAAAHAAQYVARDLPKALQLYKTLMASHPNTAEAGYSWTQVGNIINTVIPKDELQDAHMALAFAHFAQDRARPTAV